MRQHHRAKLGPAGRAQLVSVINAGAMFRAAGAAMSVAPATAHRWWSRWQHATDTERRSGAWSQDRSSRPLRCPGRTAAEQEQRICEARQRTNLGPGRLAGAGGSPAFDRARGPGASWHLTPSPLRTPDVPAS
jgi:hypothetical protein